MKKIDLNAFRKALENNRTELGNGNRKREALEIETSPDELDRIQHACERDHAMSILERDSNRLREVRTALRRIDAGIFGICVGCEASVNVKRLAAVPWTSFCIICQKAADSGQGTPARDMDISLIMAA